MQYISVEKSQCQRCGEPIVSRTSKFYCPGCQNILCTACFEPGGGLLVYFLSLCCLRPLCHECSQASDANDEYLQKLVPLLVKGSVFEYKVSFWRTEDVILRLSDCKSKLLWSTLKLQGNEPSAQGEIRAECITEAAADTKNKTLNISSSEGTSSYAFRSKLDEDSLHLWEKAINELGSRNSVRQKAEDKLKERDRMRQLRKMELQKCADQQKKRWSHLNS
eukprot:Rmarinus@m.548